MSMAKDKDKRDARRRELAWRRSLRAAQVEALCDDVAWYMARVRPEDRGRFVVWAMLGLGDWEKGAKALTPGAIETVKKRARRALGAWLGK